MYKNTISIFIGTILLLTSCTNSNVVHKEKSFKTPRVLVSTFYQLERPEQNMTGIVDIENTISFMNESTANYRSIIQEFKGFSYNLFHRSEDFAYLAQIARYQNNVLGNNGREITNILASGKMPANGMKPYGNCIEFSSKITNRSGWYSDPTGGILNINPNKYTVLSYPLVSELWFEVYDVGPQEYSMEKDFMYDKEVIANTAYMTGNGLSFIGSLGRDTRAGQQKVSAELRHAECELEKDMKSIVITVFPPQYLTGSINFRNTIEVRNFSLTLDFAEKKITPSFFFRKNNIRTPKQVIPAQKGNTYSWENLSIATVDSIEIVFSGEILNNIPQKYN